MGNADEMSLLANYRAVLFTLLQSSIHGNCPRSASKSSASSDRHAGFINFPLFRCTAERKRGKGGERSVSLSLSSPNFLLSWQLGRTAQIRKSLFWFSRIARDARLTKKGNQMLVSWNDEWFRIPALPSIWKYWNEGYEMTYKTSGNVFSTCDCLLIAAMPPTMNVVGRRHLML